jgi:hypothetical protein
VKKVSREKVSPISEIPCQQPCWYFKPIKFGQLLVLLTTEKSNFNPKKFNSRHFLSTIHIITLLSLSLSLHAVSLSKEFFRVKIAFFFFFFFFFLLLLLSVILTAVQILLA